MHKMITATEYSDRYARTRRRAERTKSKIRSIGPLAALISNTILINVIITNYYVRVSSHIVHQTELNTNYHQWWPEAFNQDHLQPRNAIKHENQHKTNGLLARDHKTATPPQLYLHHDLIHLKRQHRDASISKLLPNGPPPFRPGSLVLGLSSTGALNKLKQTKIFKRMYKSKAYYLFLDVLQQLTVLFDKVAKKKIDIEGAQMAAIQATVNKIALKGGHKLKLKWPLVMLNPHFIKEILSSPTFLVMLFHAIEVAYMSMPSYFWLKPIVKLVKQPSPEKEEEIWWKRKRFYDVLNGHGTSELQPNLKTMHFKNPGEPPLLAFPKIVNAIRQISGRPAPNPNSYKYPIDNDLQLPDVGTSAAYAAADQSVTHSGPELFPIMPELDLANEYNKYENSVYMTSEQEKNFLENQSQQHISPHVSSQQHSSDSLAQGAVSSNDWIIPENNEDQPRPRTKNNHFIDPPVKFPPGWLTQMPSRDQLMSQSEFDSLNPHERDLVLQEARNRLEEARLTNELIKQQNELVDSFINGPSDSNRIQSARDRFDSNIQRPR